MKINKNISLRIVFSVLLALLFWNEFLPAARDLYNFVSPTLHTSNVDFYAYYRGGRAYLQGLDPYNGTRDGQLFIYPPTFIPFYAQLAKLDYNDARQIWMFIYLGSFLAALLLLMARAAPPDRDKIVFVTLFIFMVSYPVRYYIRQGQIDLIVASICMAGLVLYLWRKHTLSAIFLAVATLIKVNPVLFLITFFVFFRDWKYLIRFTIATIALVILSTVFFPLDWYRIFITSVLPILSTGIPQTYNQSLIRLFAGHANFTRILTVSGLGAFTIISWRLGIRYRAALKELIEGKDTPFNMFLAVTFFFCNGLVSALFSGSTWIMTYTWFILPSAWVLVLLYQHARPWFLGMISLGVFMLNSVVLDLPFWSTVSMTGAGFCLLLLLWTLFSPGIAFGQTSGFVGES